MTIIRLFAILLVLKAQACYSQSISKDSLLNNLKKDLEVEQRAHAGVCVMDDETKISFYLLVSRSPVADLIKFTNDNNPIVRSYVFAGLLRRKVAKERILSILALHQNDTARFTCRGADVVTDWKVKDFMEIAWRLKRTNELPKIYYEKEIERLKSLPPNNLGISGISHGLIDKKDLLKIDSLSFSGKDGRVVSFSLFAGEKEIESTNCFLTPEMKQMIESCKIGEFIGFYNIKVLVNDNTIRHIPSLSVRLK